MSDGEVSPAAKWIGGGLIGLVVLGLLVAFASSPTATPSSSPSTSSSTAPTTQQLNTPSLAVKAPIPQTVAAGGAARLGVHSGSGSGSGSGSTVEEVRGAKAVLTAENNGDTVQLKVGDKLAIRLVENKTTGFGWSLEDPADATKQGLSAVPATLELVHDKSRKSMAKGPSGRALVGAPGEHVFVLRGVVPGSSDLCVAYRRPWLPVTSTEPAQKFCVKVNVSPREHDTK